MTDQTDQQDTGKSSTPTTGFRFNSTGREDTNVEVLQAKKDPGAGTRKLVVFLAILIGIIALGAVSFKRSNLTWQDIMKDNHSSFGSQQSGSPDSPGSSN